MVSTLRAMSLLLGPNITPADEAARAARVLVDQLRARMGYGSTACTEQTLNAAERSMI